MPRLSDTMERGTIARWLVAEGDPVHEGDVLAEIETDKATMELNAYSDGVLLRILVQDGEAAELGAPIAVVGAEGEDVSGFSAASGNGDSAAADGAGETEAPAPAESEAAVAAPAAPAADAAAPAPQAPAAAAGEALKASPVARRMASGAGLDLRGLAGKGSGPDGRIVRVDVERALAGGQASAPAAAAPAAVAPVAAAPAPASARAPAPPPEAD